MKDTHYVIGLDFGTLSGRAVLVDTQTGDVIATAVKEYEHGIIQDYLPDGITKLEADWCLQDPDDYLAVLTTAIPQLFATSGADAARVIGLSLDFTACTVLPLDRQGTPLCKLPQYRARPHAYVKLWKHHAAQPEADEINEKLAHFPNDVAAYYGQRISAEILLPKALQILHDDPALYREMDTLSEAPDWLNRLLTGNRKRSINTAGYKAMYFNERGYPSEAFFRHIHPALAGFVREKLTGDICQMTERFGLLNRQWAQKLRLPENIAVGCSIIDAHAGMPGCGITRPGQMMLALGTSSVQSMLSDTPYSSNGVIGTIRDGVIPGYYMWESGLAAVGDKLAWYAGQCGPLGEAGDPMAVLTRRAGLLAPGECGLLALDWWTGNKTPYVNGHLAGVLVGLRLDTAPEQIFRALMESTAFGTRVILDTFEQAGKPVEEIIACGGIVDKNPLLMQIYADVLGREIKVAGSNQTMALGAAIYAAVAAGSKAGGYDSLDEAARHMTRLKAESYRPNRANHAVYGRLYTQYQALSGYFGRDQVETLQCLRALRETAMQPQ